MEQLGLCFLKKMEGFCFAFGHRRRSWRERRSWRGKAQRRQRSAAQEGVDAGTQQILGGSTILAQVELMYLQRFVLVGPARAIVLQKQRECWSRVSGYEACTEGTNVGCITNGCGPGWSATFWAAWGVFAW
jgi:hypothetical protein